MIRVCRGNSPAKVEKTELEKAFEVVFSTLNSNTKANDN